MLFVHDERQRELAEASREAVARRLSGEVVTPIETIGSFTRAEDYHQKYYLRLSGRVYDELTACYPEDRDFVDSTAAARLNGYYGGHGSYELYDLEHALYGLSEEALSILYHQVEATEGKCDVE